MHRWPLLRPRDGPTAATLVSCALASLALASLAGASSQTAAHVKAGFLHNFAIFVAWPGETAAQQPQRVIGIIGTSAVSEALERLREASVRGSAILVKRLADGDDVSQCHILFIASLDDRAVALALARVGNAPVLTVGETPRFTRVGGIVRLYIEDDRVRFEVNLGSAERAGIRISSKVLSLAKLTRADQ